MPLPTTRDFLKLDVNSQALRVRAFGIEDFGQGESATSVIWDETIPLVR